MIRRWFFSVAVSFLMMGLCVGPVFSGMSCNDSWITDSMGRRISTDRAFERIISLYGAHTENLFTLGAGRRIIGVSPHEDWPPAAKEKPVYSYHDGLEKFLSDRPDLILIRPMIDRGYQQLISRMEAHGITVVSLQPKNVDEAFVYWEVLGKLSGCEASALKMKTTFIQTVHQIQEKTATVQQKKRVYFESIHDSMRTFAPSAMALFVLETAGGVNVADQAVPRRNTVIADFGKERILSLADEIDVYLAQVGPMNKPTIEMIKSEPGFHLIRAVRKDRVYLINEKVVSRPTLRLLEGIYRVGGLLYPELFSIATENANGAMPYGNITTSHLENKP